MKRFYFMFFLLFGISNYSFGKVKFQKAIGLINELLVCKYHIDSKGEVFCDQKFDSKQKFPIKGVGNIQKAAVQGIWPGREEMFVYEIKNGYYKLAYIWDTINHKAIIFDRLKNQDIIPLSIPLYMKAFLKDTYEVRYFWFKPNKPYEAYVKDGNNSVNIYRSLGDGLRSFNFTSEHNVDLYDKLNGKVIDHISGDKIKNYKIDFSHAKSKDLGPDSTKAHMVMKTIVLDSKYDKNDLWFKIKIPLTQTYDELDLVYSEKHGIVPHSITFKQSIFDKAKIGWIKVFDEDGFFVFR